MGGELGLVGLVALAHDGDDDDDNNNDNDDNDDDDDNDHHGGEAVLLLGDLVGTVGDGSDVLVSLDVGAVEVLDETGGGVGVDVHLLLDGVELGLRSGDSDVDLGGGGEEALGVLDGLDDDGKRRILELLEVLLNEVSEDALSLGSAEVAGGDAVEVVGDAEEDVAAAGLIVAGEDDATGGVGRSLAMPYLSQVSITLSSRMLPPAWAMYSTPLLWARSMLSPNGKKASEPRATFVFCAIQAFFSSAVSTSGFSVKNISHVPSRSTSSYSSLMYTSMVLSRSARLMPGLNGRFITFGHWRSHHISAFCPARRVQCMRLCCPAPMPMACPSLT